MYWNLKQEEKYALFTPVMTAKGEFEKAFDELDSNTNKIIDARTIPFSEALKSKVSKIYHLHLKQEKSFIIVVKDKFLLEELEELFIVVPTISEAIDYIYMEELERNL